MVDYLEMRTRARLLLTVLTAGTTTLACGPDNAAWRERAVAISTQYQDVVERVEYTPGNWLDPGYLEVVVRSSVDESDAATFYCEVLSPLRSLDQVRVLMEVGASRRVVVPDCPE